MKLTRELLHKIINEEREKLTKGQSIRGTKKSLSESLMVPLQPIQRMERKEESLESKWMRIAGIDTKSLNEGEVVDMFSSDQTKQNAVEKIARALAARAEEMLDADGDGDDIAVHVDHKLFLSPYTDFEGHGGEVTAMAVRVYEDYVSGKAGDQAESLDSIIERISIDYFDEDIEYALEALGDDRWTMPHTWDDDDDQMMKTKDLASQQDAADIEKDEVDFADFLDSLGQNVVEFPEED